MLGRYWLRAYAVRMSRVSLLPWLFTCAALVGAGCDRATSKPASSVSSDPLTTAVSPRFTEVARDWGVDFRYENGAGADRYLILESLGGGVAIFDYDQDGLSDLAFAGGGTIDGPRSLAPSPLGLFRQVGPGQMAAAAASRLGPARHYNHGLAAADSDGDGFPDLLVTGYGGVQLFRNLGDGTWDDGTDEAGLADPAWSSSAAWGDLDGDGNLDLYAAHYVDWSFDNDPPCYNDQKQREVCSPLAFRGVTDRLWMSEGDGTFRDATDEAGLVTGGKGVGVLIADLDLDGDVDIYVANDTTARFLYENKGRGKLAEVGAASGADLSRQGEAEGSMGTDVADFDLDGLPDLGVANFEQETFALLRNRGGLVFDHASHETGIGALSREYVGWGVLFFDLDLDGDEDLFVSNGHVERRPRTAPVRQRPILMINEGGRRFVNVAAQAGAYFREPHPARGAAAGDIDRDGDIDLVVSQIGEPAAMLRNETPRVGESLSIRLIGTTSNRDAIGAVVRVHSGGSTQIRQRKGGGSYASTSDSRLLFGLPHSARSGEPASTPILEVTWPAGAKQMFPLPERSGRFIAIEGGPLVHEAPISP